MEGVGLNKKLFNNSIFRHNNLPSSKHLSQYLRSNFKDIVWNAMTMEDTLVEFSIVRSVSYEGSKDSGIGKGVIYATAGHLGKGPRYDYIIVKTKRTDEVTKEVVVHYELAQVLMILQVNIYESLENKRVLKIIKIGI